VIGAKWHGRVLGLLDMVSLFVGHDCLVFGQGCARWVKPCRSGANCASTLLFVFCKVGLYRYRYNIPFFHVTPVCYRYMRELAKFAVYSPISYTAKTVHFETFQTRAESFRTTTARMSMSPAT
jgi:hypothetical protein